MVACAFTALPAVAVPSAGQPNLGSKPDVIPAQFQGVWDTDAAACAAEATEMRLYVGSDRFRFVDTIGAVKQVRRLDDRSIVMFASYISDGGEWEDEIGFTLSPDGDKLTVQGRKLTRVRCPASK